MAEPPNLPLKTAGGGQLWTDHLWRGGWRIQQNALTGHWRLLDTADVRRGWGSRENCMLILDRLQPAGSGDEPPRHAVVLLHGLMRTCRSMKPVEQAIGGSVRFAATPLDVIRFAYASSRRSVADHAAALREVLEGLPPQTELSYVGHSMGNIVVRHLLGDLQRGEDPYRILQRSRAMVMIGPPNQGAAIARRLGSLELFELVLGPGGMELGKKWEAFAERLAVPAFPFAIVAGDWTESPIQNPLVDGDSDFIVSVEEAKLQGAEKFVTVDAVHAFLMRDERVLRITVDFLASHIAD